eukprot:scaffold227431_cov31-Tisochrysis_lutea.AAC.2
MNTYAAHVALGCDIVPPPASSDSPPILPCGHWTRSGEGESCDGVGLSRLQRSRRALSHSAASGTGG